MDCATCRLSGRIWGSTCLICYAWFFVDAHPCHKVDVLIANDTCDDVENNILDEMATPRRPNQKSDVATKRAKLVMFT